jgi:hypothetical protein
MRPSPLTCKSDAKLATPAKEVSLWQQETYQSRAGASNGCSLLLSYLNKVAHASCKFDNYMDGIYTMMLVMSLLKNVHFIA